MTTNANAQDTTNVRQALMAAAQRKEQAEQAANAAKIAPRKQAPAQAPDQDVLATILAKLTALEDQNKALASENAALKSGKGAGKAEKAPTIVTKNCTHTYDAKTGKLTVVFDLNADIIDADTGAPKVSKLGKTTGVAFFQGSFLDKKGRKVGVGCNAYHKLDK